jgi:hypothetical protein
MLIKCAFVGEGNFKIDTHFFNRLVKCTLNYIVNFFIIY